MQKLLLIIDKSVDQLFDRLITNSGELRKPWPNCGIVWQDYVSLKY